MNGRERSAGRWPTKAAYLPFDSLPGKPITCSAKPCIFSYNLLHGRADSRLTGHSKRFDEGKKRVASKQEERSCRLKAAERRDATDSTYNEVTHAFRTRIFSTFTRSLSATGATCKCYSRYFVSWQMWFSSGNRGNRNIVSANDSNVNYNA